MSTVGPTTSSTTTPSIEQSAPSKLTTFTRVTCGVTSIGVIVAEVIRRLNSEVEIVPFANKYLPAPTTNLMIASTAIAIFLATFMLSRENTAQPKNQEVPQLEEPKSPFVIKSKNEVKEIHENSYLYLAFFVHFMEIQPNPPHAFAPSFEEEKGIITFLEKFRKELKNLDREKPELSVNRESIERFSAIQEKYVLLSISDGYSLLPRITTYTKENRNILPAEKMNPLLNLESKLEKMQTDFRNEASIVLKRAEWDLVESIIN